MAHFKLVLFSWFSNEFHIPMRVYTIFAVPNQKSAMKRTKREKKHTSVALSCCERMKVTIFTLSAWHIHVERPLLCFFRMFVYFDCLHKYFAWASHENGILELYIVWLSTKYWIKRTSKRHHKTHIYTKRSQRLRYRIRWLARGATIYVWHRIYWLT